MSHPPAPAPSPPPSRTPGLLAGILLLDVVCFAIVMPLLASYGAQFGASPAAIGALVAVYPLLHLGLAPLWGLVSDRVGRRPVLLVGMIGTLVSSVVFALAQDYALLLLSRLLAGGLGATLNVAQAYVADESPPDRRTRAMGLVGAAFGVGFILGPAIGAVAARFGTAAPGLAATAVAAVNLVLAVLWLPEPARRTARTVRLGRRFGPLRVFAAPFTAAFCSTLAFAAIYVVFPLHAESALGFDRTRVGLLFAWIGLAAAVVQGGLVGRLAARHGEARLVRGGGVLMAAGLATVPFVGPLDGAGWPLFLAALLAVGAGFGLTSPAEAGYVSRAAGPDDQGRAMGALQSVNATARIAGSLASGVVLQLAGGPTAFVAGAVIALLATGAGFLMRDAPGAARPRGATPPGPTAATSEP